MAPTRRNRTRLSIYGNYSVETLAQMSNCTANQCMGSRDVHLSWRCPALLGINRCQNPSRVRVRGITNGEAGHGGCGGGVVNPRLQLASPGCGWTGGEGRPISRLIPSGENRAWRGEARKRLKGGRGSEREGGENGRTLRKVRSLPVGTSGAMVASQGKARSHFLVTAGVCFGADSALWRFHRLSVQLINSESARALSRSARVSPANFSYAAR